MTRTEQYAAWIAERAYSPGTCVEATWEMVEAFPELSRVRGHVILMGVSKPWTHWWCKEADGTIVDPTASQFPTLLAYDEWQEGGEEPVGRCANCGDYIYASSGYTNTVCSAECARAYERYLMEGL